MSLCALEEAAQPILGTYVQSAEAQGAVCYKYSLLLYRSRLSSQFLIASCPFPGKKK